MMRGTSSFPAVALFALLTAGPASAQVRPDQKSLGIDVSGMDKSVRPQDDFFRYVNGAWADRTQIPADASSYGSFNELRENALAAVKGILEAVAAEKAPAGSIKQKIGDFYRSFMDTAHIEKLGIKPLEDELEMVRKISSTKDLPAAFAHLGQIGVRGPLAAVVSQDPKFSNVYAVLISQSGLGMPDRDYYLRNDAKFIGIRKAYADYIAQLFTLAKQPDPPGAAQRVLALETKLAQKQWDRPRQRDPNAMYNKMTLAQLRTLTPNFDWHQLFTKLGASNVQEAIVRQPDYAQAADALIAATPLDTWQEYLTFALLNNYADYLTRAFVDARFSFNERTLAGQQELRARWKRGVATAENALGEPIGKLYIEKYFTPEAKARMDALVRNLLAAFKAGIDDLEWMTPATKAQAQQKLAKYSVKIGYPDKWRDYSGLQVNGTDLIGNVMRARRFQSADNWSRLGKPVERWRWGMSPQTVNASYSSTNNEITFPAGILQPPFFNVNADDAVNYGAIGVVIGHEISHGFDDSGRKSDGDGNLRDWWTPEDAKRFDERAVRIIQPAAGPQDQRQADDGRKYRRLEWHGRRAPRLSHIAGREGSPAH